MIEPGVRFTMKATYDAFFSEPGTSGLGGKRISVTRANRCGLIIAMIPMGEDRTPTLTKILALLDCGVIGWTWAAFIDIIDAS